MSKFKVGDRVRRVGNTCEWAPYGYECIVEHVYLDGCIEYIGEDDAGHASEPKDWELVQPAYPSPVVTKTVTTKEIVPGKYGPVSIEHADRAHVCVEMVKGFSTASELREASRIFLELADALEA
jgi:hypothetical protein